MLTITIQAIWDEEAEVWVAESDDLLGLATEAETFETLLAKLKVMVPERIELNGIAHEGGDVPVELVAKRTEHIRIGV